MQRAQVGEVDGAVLCKVALAMKDYQGKSWYPGAWPDNRYQLESVHSDDCASIGDADSTSCYKTALAQPCSMTDAHNTVPEKSLRTLSGSKNAGLAQP